MNTEILKLDPWNPDRQSIIRAASILKSGGLVAFPTETVYGLGANGTDARAVDRIFQAKGRPSDNPLILHLSDPDQAPNFAKIDGRARAVMEAFWPGPLTLVLPALPIVPKVVTAGLDTVAFRMPDHPVALALIEAAGFPVAAPSANRSGRPSPTDAAAVADDLSGRIDLILDAGSVELGVESTVIDLTDKKILLLRPGGVPLEKLTAFFGERLGFPDETERRRSPGTRYRHYAPAVPVHIWYGGNFPEGIDLSSAGFMGMAAPPTESERRGSFKRAIVFNSKENYAKGIFAGFRSLESNGVRDIIVQWPDTEGIGLALQDRIQRAAER